MKKYYLVLLFTVAVSSVMGQEVLTSSCNYPRPGDRLVKQRVEYKAPGSEGVDIIWDFSEQSLLDDSYELIYVSVGEKNYGEKIIIN